MDVDFVGHGSSGGVVRYESGINSGGEEYCGYGEEDEVIELHGNREMN